jgi:Zn-dependent protease with chaperone function
MYFLVAISLVFTVLLGLGLALSVVSAAVWRLSAAKLDSISSSARAAVLFWLRVLPLAVSIAVALLFVLPAFLLYEPHEPEETVSWKLAAVIAIAVFGVATASFRVFASWWRTRRLITEWQEHSEPLSLAGVTVAAYRLQHDFPVFAIVGVLRPQLFVSERVLAMLTEKEIAAVLSHEYGHIESADNLKRLLIRLCGDILVAPMGRSLDRAWSESSESAADEFAVSQGGRQTALDLAGALIKIARIIPDNAQTPAPLASFVLWSGESLAARIRRLLELADVGAARRGSLNKVALMAAAVLGAVLAIVVSDHTVLSQVHAVSETLLAILQ